MAHERRWLMAIMLLALSLRLGAAFYLGNSLLSAQQVRAFDQRSYHALALSLLEGRGYSFDRDWYPGFTKARRADCSLVISLSALSDGRLQACRSSTAGGGIAQVLAVSVLQTWLVYRLGRRLFGSRVGLAGALLSAVYAYFIFYDATLMSEPFFIVCVLALLNLGYELSGKPDAENPPGRSAGGWALLGLVGGLAALLRQTILFWLPIQVGWMLWTGIGPRAGRKLLAALGVLVLLIAPWTIRNYIAFGAFLPLNSNAGFAFYSATHPDHGTHFDQDYAAPLPEDLLRQDLNEAQWNTALTRRGLEFILQDPLRYGLLTLDKIEVHFRFWFSPELDLSSNLMRTLSYGLYLPFFIAGLLISRRNWRQCSLVYLFTIVFSLLHILTWAGIRYRLPVDAALMPFVGLAVIRLVQKAADMIEGSRKNHETTI